jgi:hypothetical protein
VAGSEAVVKYLPRLIAFAMLSFLVSCSSSSSTPSSPTLSSIAVTPPTPSVAAGLPQQFKATGTYSDGSTKDLTTTVTWSSSSTTVATIASTGLATSKAVGSTMITAVSAGITGVTTLTVTAATLVSIAVTPVNDTIAPGTFLQFTATGTYTDGSTQNLTTTATWSSGDSTIVSVSNTAPNIGLGAAVTNPPPLVGAATVITATLGSVSGNTGISVSAPTLNSITITDGSVSIAARTSHQYTAIGVYSDGGQRNVTDQVTWGSSDMTIATISATGRGSGLVAGTSMISASLGSVSAPAVTLTVTGATLSTVVVAPVMNTIAPLTQLQFTAVAKFTDNSTQNITQDATWSSSAIGIATVDTTNQIGRVTGVSGGPVTISATLGGHTGMAPLMVSSATLSSITFRPPSPPPVNIATLSTLQLLAIGNFSDSSTQFITSYATWSSSDDTIASVSTTGNVLGVAPGAATITASLGGVNGTVNINVENVSGFAVTPATASIPPGAVARLQAVATLTDGSTDNVNASAIWTSSAPAVALAGDASDTRSLVFGVSPGTTLIGALFEPQIASATVTVTNATLSSLMLTPSTSSITLSDVQNYKLTGTYSDGTTQVLVNTQAQWTSDVTVAIVSPSGTATPTAVGTTTITAQFGGKTATATLTVTP